MAPHPLVRFILVACLSLTSLALPVFNNQPKPGLSRSYGHGLERRSNSPSSTDFQGIDFSLLSQMRLMSEYALAAYLPTNYNSTGTPISCINVCPGVNESQCSRVEIAGAGTIEEFQHTKRYDDYDAFYLKHTARG